MTHTPEGAHEDELLAYLADRFGRAPKGQLWVGDDAAVVGALVRPVISTDVVVEGVHVDRRWCSPADMGWKSVSVNVSDIAAMGGRTRALVIAIAGASAAEIREIMQGASDAAAAYGCDIVGGDLSDAPTLVISATALGDCEVAPVLRSGAREGDVVYVTGPLGASNAGLKILIEDHSATGELVTAHQRPIARVGEGLVLGALGVHAMLDCSDGLAKSVGILAAESKAAIDLEVVPCHPAVTFEDALHGGEDYELVFTAAPDLRVTDAFDREGLREPIAIGSVRDGPPAVHLRGELLVPIGYEHHL